MKHVVFCLPGQSYTGGFFESWNELRSAVAVRGDIQMTIVRGGLSSIVHLRNQLVAHGVDGPQKDALPFGGMPYDYMMWIDSDTVFEPDDFYKLLEADKDIITGMVPIDMSGRGALGHINNFSPTKYLNIAAVGPKKPIFKIGFCGFAFLLVKHGVFESMSYPWFWPEYSMVDDRIICPSEDFAWCIRANKLGWQIYAHPAVNLGHQKEVIMQVDRDVVPEPA